MSDPVTGRSASFRLRFRFVRVVRAVPAGEAKLCGRMYNVILIAGPSWCEFPRARVPLRVVFRGIFAALRMGFNYFCMFVLGLGCFFDAF